MGALDINVVPSQIVLAKVWAKKFRNAVYAALALELHAAKKLFSVLYILYKT
jgi:hypothetical protein